jgi:phosphotransferase system HPr-like phosphotransfer protein
MTTYTFSAEMQSDMFARPAYHIEKLVKQMESALRQKGFCEGYTVSLQRTNPTSFNGNNGDARDVFSIIGMGLRKGDVVEVKVDGPSDLEHELKSTGAGIAAFLEKDLRKLYFPRDNQLTLPLTL